jgi:nucleoside-diphosphate-sugar epimerase
VNHSSRELLVTGASGFLGSRIVCLAREAGWKVRALYRRPQTPVEGLEIFIGDIGDAALMRRASEGVTAIVHAAGLAHVFGPGARDSSGFDAVNEVGTCNVVEAALESNVPHLVLVSSVSVYGRYPGAKCDEFVSCHPQGPYAQSKWRGELRATERMMRGSGSLTVLRFATIYGEGDQGNVARLIGALDRGRFVWPGDGENRKSLIYKEDAARACLLALERPSSGTEVFNVSAPPATMREIVTAICEALERPVPRLAIPLSFLKATGAISRRIGDPGQIDSLLQKSIRDDVYDGARFETAFEFYPSVSLSEGLRREVKFFRTARQPARP